MRSKKTAPAAPSTMRVLPLPMLLTAVVTLGVIEALLVWRFGWSISFVAYGYFGVVAVVLGSHDLATRRVPDAIVLPSYPIAIGLLAVASGVGHEWGAFVRSSEAMVGVGLVFLALALVMVGQLGLADVKLAMLVGLCAGWLSWSTVWFAVFAGFLLGWCWGIPKAIRRRELRYRFAFGPFLLAGAIVAVVLG